MTLSRYRRLTRLLLGVTFFAMLLPAAFAQEKTAQGASAEVVLGQLSEAFSGSHSVHEIQLSGSADWYAGSLVYSGSASMTVSADGSSHVQLSLAAAGQRTETQTGTGSNAICQWSKGDGIAHVADQSSCRRSVSWFLPALSLQSSQLSKSLNVVDLGNGTIGPGSATYRHLQSQYSSSDVPANVSKPLTQRSTTDIGLDPTTLLPAVLMYTVHSDNRSSALIGLEIRYSDYRSIDGVKIPFLIQRYVNHSLQLEVRVSSAQVN